MENIIPCYHFEYFRGNPNDAGIKLTKFLNEHPNIEIIKLEIIENESSYRTSIYLLYKE